MKAGFNLEKVTKLTIKDQGVLNYMKREGKHIPGRENWK